MLSVKKCTVKELNNESKKRFIYPNIINIYPTNNPNEGLITQINKDILEDVLVFKETIETINNTNNNSHTDYKVYLKKRQLISISIKFSDLSSTKEITYINTYNYDISKNKKLELNDIFKQDTDYAKLIADLVQKKLNLKDNEEGTLLVTPNGSDSLVEIYEDQTFYICPNKIVICFSSYELGPNFADVVEIDLEFEDYKEYLTEYTINEIWEL